MRKIVWSLTAAIVAAGAPSAATAQDTAELIEARAIIQLALPDAERDATFGGVVEQLLGQFRQTMPADAVTDPGLREIMETHLDSLPTRLMPVMSAHLPKIIEATAVAYTNEFSLEELREIHAFARTDAGRHYLSQSAKLVGDPAVAAANVAYMNDLQKLRQETDEEFMQAVIAYLEEHPEVAEQLQAGGAE